MSEKKAVARAATNSCRVTLPPHFPLTADSPVSTLRAVAIYESAKVLRKVGIRLFCHWFDCAKTGV